MNSTAKTSSIIVKSTQLPKENYTMMPTWAILVFLVIAMVGLKSFIYIKDVKRNGK